ncbi:hypothetical protein GUJ93_ZPchr0008g11527 [Zizania palustris]|uniref:Uncharacterized protein n=1 Tax=Zizania palustris TaxID=103762 RepID=A0A8J5RFR2_ZIZPA|nr:hypothetical protein GUJ93_ZPchr0008g11527 [Zizania palustris]
MGAATNSEKFQVPIRKLNTCIFIVVASPRTPDRWGHLSVRVRLFFLGKGGHRPPTGDSRADVEAGEPSTSARTPVHHRILRFASGSRVRDRKGTA